MTGESQLPGGRTSRWRNPRFVIPLAAAIVAFSLLGYWAFVAVSPLVECAVVGVPSSSSGTECYQGTDYYFITVSAPAAGAVSNSSFHGVDFLLGTIASGGSVSANVTELDGSSTNLYLYSDAGRGTAWQTQVSADGNTGIQSHGGSIGSIRLLVAVDPASASTVPMPEILL